MIIAGAGGHGREVVYSLLLNGVSVENICFFDEDDSLKTIEVSGKSFAVISDLEALKEKFSSAPDFYLGVGNPKYRKKFNELLSQNGGKLKPILLSTPPPEFSSSPFSADLMRYTFVGPAVSLGIGVLLNTGAQVHHDSSVGDYAEIGPKAMLLGGSTVGNMCSIGAGAIILPGVTLGDGVVVGAGAVVTKDQKSPAVLKGIPAKSSNS